MAAKSPIRPALAGAILSIGLGLLGMAAWHMVRPAPAPALTFTTVDGEHLTLAGMRGRPVLVVFWATTCGVCLREVPHLAALYRELAPRGLEVVAVAMSYDPPDRVLAFRERLGMPYPVALDLEGAARRAFGGVHATPTSFLVDAQGRVVYRRVGALDYPWLGEELRAMLAASAGPEVGGATANPVTDG
jgi:peroxiredoxin